MTGFGRAVLDAPFGRLTVEIQSVNRKFLEVFVSIPKEFSQFEHEVRKWVTEAVSRGGVSVRIYLTPTLSALEDLLPNAEMLKGLKKSWDKIAKKAGLDPESIDLPFLMQYLPSSPKEASDRDLKDLKTCVQKALSTLVSMKKTEGKTLARDFAKYLEEIEEMLKEVEKHSPEATKKMRARLFEKMEEALKIGPELEERLLREVALFAEKVDITEEITRLKSHIQQFKALLKQETVGRKMDFLIQEMGREVNTIGSKSMESRIAHTVVSMKSALEKLREQVQNIE
jgi:uncharacterized protein (TIGR00255 family)